MYDFIAFRALVALLKDRNLSARLDEVYDKCKADDDKPATEVKNYVKELYGLFTADEISAKISEIVRPKQIFADVQVIYQTIEDLHTACPKNLGDWYFTGNYPTPGGNKVANRAFINYMEGRSERAY
jgi:amidophosphoribosyltransferase